MALGLVSAAVAATTTTTTTTSTVKKTIFMRVSANAKIANLLALFHDTNNITWNMRIYNDLCSAWTDDGGH